MMRDGDNEGEEKGCMCACMRVYVCVSMCE